jgi:hypothetical protein
LWWRLTKHSGRDVIVVRTRTSVRWRLSTVNTESNPWNSTHFISHLLSFLTFWFLKKCNGFIHIASHAFLLNKLKSRSLTHPTCEKFVAAEQSADKTTSLFVI